MAKSSPQENPSISNSNSIAILNSPAFPAPHQSKPTEIVVENDVTGDLSNDVTSEVRQRQYATAHSLDTYSVYTIADGSAGLKMNSVSPQSDTSTPWSPLDPISRQIFERTQFHQRHNSTAANAYSGGSAAVLTKSTDNASDLSRVDTNASSRAGKDKKKGVSFLSRIMGSKKRDEDVEVRDHISELSDNRSSGNDVEVFSDPVGFVPHFPPPPKYIKVKAQSRTKRDFDRLFLAQVLLDEQKKKKSNKPPSIDTKIHGINETPQEPEKPAPRNTSRAVWAAEFSRDGKYFAAAGQDMKLRIWAVISTPEDREPDEQAVSEGSDDGENVRLNAPVFKQKLIREYDGHTSSILDLSWSKNNFILSSSMDKTVRLYHVTREECLCAFKHNDFVTSIQFHPRDDRFFLAGSLDSRIRLWSIPDKTVAYMQQTPDMVTAVAFTPDGKTSIAGCLNGMCILFDTEGLKAHSQIHVKSARGKNSKGSKVTGIDTIAVARPGGAPDVKLLITSNDSRIRMYNLKDRNLEVKFRGHENSCSQIRATFSDDGRFVVCGSEDRKVYIWPTGPLERPDSDKRPMEVFEAHSSIVTVALMASTKTKRTLAQSGDPLYDLCNPPPVTLISRADSIISSRAPTHRSGLSEDPDARSNSPKKAPESPAYIARQAHVGGHILVTADYSGQIKVFRQDCAYQKRRAESWDTNSSFSKKMLARSGSVARRSSIGSSVHRASINYDTGNNRSTDRIMSWRNSISINGNGNGGSANGSPNLSTNAISASDTNLIRASLSTADKDPKRDVSPSKKWANRLSLRSSPRRTSLSNKNPPAASSQLVGSNTNKAHIQVELDPPPQTPTNTSSSAAPHLKPHTDDSAAQAASPSSFHSATQSPPSTRPAVNRADNSDVSALSALSGTSLSNRPAMNSMIPHDQNNDLFLIDGQSFIAWDVERNVAGMVSRFKAPRTPGAALAGGGGGHDYLDARRGSGGGGDGAQEGSGAASLLSRLSSEISSENREGSGDEEVEGQSPGAVTGGSDEVRCRNCGSSSFKATMGSRGHRLRCRRCGTVV